MELLPESGGAEEVAEEDAGGDGGAWAVERFDEGSGLLPELLGLLGLFGCGLLEFLELFGLVDAEGASSGSGGVPVMDGGLRECLEFAEERVELVVVAVLSEGEEHHGELSFGVSGVDEGLSDDGEGAFLLFLVHEDEREMADVGDLVWVGAEDGLVGDGEWRLVVALVPE